MYTLNDCISCLHVPSFRSHAAVVALGFGPGWIRTLVSMATDSSHRLTMGKTKKNHL